MPDYGDPKYHKYGVPPAKVARTMDVQTFSHRYYHQEAEQMRPNMEQFYGEPLPFMAMMRKARAMAREAKISEKNGVAVPVKGYGTFRFGPDGWGFEPNAKL